jgi:Na+/H+ antiporter NhaD/arsenite permease-like protein
MRIGKLKFGNYHKFLIVLFLGLSPAMLCAVIDNVTIFLVVFDATRAIIEALAVFADPAILVLVQAGKAAAFGNRPCALIHGREFNN